MLIAHVSDLHLLCLRDVRPSLFFGKRLTGGANLLFNRGGQFPERVARALIADINEQRVDHVVVSGDVSNLAFPAELELGREVLGGLRLDAADVTVVPGNHDCYCREAAANDHFGRIMRPFLRADRQPGPGHFPFLRLRGEELAVLALSSARVSAPLLATGSVGARQLRQAERLLALPECRDRFRLVVLHHPPAGEHGHWHNRLTDADEVLRMLRRAGPELVVHGHHHRFQRSEIDRCGKAIPLIGVGSGTWLSPRDPERRAQYNVYEIAGRELVRVSVRRLDLASERFAAVAP